MIRTKLIARNCMNLLLCSKSALSSANNELSREFLRQRAIAARAIIRYLRALPPITGQPPNTKIYDQKLLSQLNSNPLSTLIINMLRNYTILSDDNKEENISEDVIKFFEQMFNPKEGVVLPYHFQVQQRIKEAMNTQNETLSTNQSKGKQKNIKKFSFFPNRLSTVEIFQILNKFDTKTLLYGPAGIAKTTSIVFYCYLSSMITDYEFQFDQQIALGIPHIIYLSYKKFPWENKNQQKIMLRNIAKSVKSQCPKKLHSEILEQKQIDQESFGLNYQKIRDMFKSRNIKLKVVLDQFNSYVSQIRSFNQTIKDQKAVLSTQQKLMKQRLGSENYYWIMMSNILSDHQVLFNSSKNIQQNLLNKQSGQYFGLDLNHHSLISQKDIDFYKRLKSVEGKKQMLRALFFELERCSPSDQITNKIKVMQHNFFRNTDSYFREWDLSMTHYHIRQFIQIKIHQTQIIYKQIEESSEENINLLVENIVEKVQNWFVHSMRKSAKKFCQQGQNMLQFDKFTLLTAVKMFLINKSVEEQKQNKNYQNKQTIITEQQLNQYGFSSKLTQQNIDKNLFDFGDQQKIISIKLKQTDEDFLQIVGFLGDMLIQKVIKDHQFMLNYLSWIKGTNNNALIGMQLQAFVIYLLRKYKSTVILSGYDKFIIDQTNRTFEHFLGNYDISLQKRFSDMMVKGVQHVLGFPVKKNEKGKKKDVSIPENSPNNPSIDFLILIGDESQKYTINSVDLTMSSDKATIKQKVDRAKQTIKKALKNYYGPQLIETGVLVNNQPKIRYWKHFIVSRSMQSRKTQSFKQKIKYKKKNIPVECKIIQRSLYEFDIEVKNPNEEVNKLKEVIYHLKN